LDAWDCKHLTLEAQDLEGIKQKIKEAGFQQEKYSANKSIEGPGSNTWADPGTAGLFPAGARVLQIL